MSNYPRISIITPSYNQASFIEETIKSVALQNYPNTEYIVIDGGSNDGSTEVIERNIEHISYYVSEEDEGQSDAINKGFELATGEIICWLNSDDLLEPGAFWTVAKYYQDNQADFIYGDGWVFKHGKRWSQRYIKPGILSPESLTYLDPIQQPSTFWSRSVLDEIGFLDRTLHYAMDWEFFIRISKKFQLTYVPFPFSAYRQHKEHKTSSGGLARAAEIMNVVEKYASEDWIKVYSALYPYCNEIREMKSFWRRLYTARFCIKHPQIFLNYDFQKMKIVASML